MAEENLMNISKSKGSLFESICVDIFLTAPLKPEMKKAEQLMEKIIHSKLEYIEKLNKTLILDIITHSFGMK